MKVVSVEVGSDLYVAGRGEDGDYVAVVFFVIVTFVSGLRWAHQVSFPGCKIVCDESTDGETNFVDTRAEAEADAERLAARVRAALLAGRKLDSARWYGYRAEYGSRAYVEEVAEMTEEERRA